MRTTVLKGQCTQNKHSVSAYLWCMDLIYAAFLSFLEPESFWSWYTFKVWKEILYRKSYRFLIANAKGFFPFIDSAVSVFQVVKYVHTCHKLFCSCWSFGSWGVYFRMCAQQPGSEAIYFTEKMSSHLCLVILLINKQRDDSPFACTVHVNNTLLFRASLLLPWLANFFLFAKNTFSFNEDDSGWLPWI